VTLWHLYPELGIGAKTQREPLPSPSGDAIPDVLPPADDLSGERMLNFSMPTRSPSSPCRRSASSNRSKSRKHVDLHLIFDGNRLAERKCS
jgi:hypothetical protein